MTSNTLGRGPLELAVSMTGCTVQAAVFSIQRKKSNMIEIGHTVCAIMAIQASRAVLIQMLGHETRIMLGVTFRAVGKVVLFERKHRRKVSLIAGLMG
jgi:hypothetical protein